MLASPLPHFSLLTVCGIEELEGHRQSRVTHVLSILDPDRAIPDAFENFDTHHRVTLRFNDIIEPRAGMVMPTRDDVADILRFGEDLARHSGAEKHLLIHCHFGISRSTAAMAILMAQSSPDLDEDELFTQLVAMRPQTWPNSVMIDYADTLLNRGGRLSAALRRVYTTQLAARPERAESLRAGGRGREVDLATEG